MSLRVLIIEDHTDTAISTAALLRCAGYEVRIAPTAAAGLKAAGEFRPRAILCDIALPQMSGYEVARALRRNPALAQVYLVAISGYGREEDQQRAFAAGFDQHFIKPVDFEVLRQLLGALPNGQD